MKTISELFESKRQRELGNSVVYLLEDGPADGKTPVRCVAFDGAEHTLLCGFFVLSAATSEYALAIMSDVFGRLRATEFDESGTVGGMRCVLAKYDRTFLNVSGTPDPLIFRMERNHSVRRGRLS
jgi:hypothetical protein